MRWVLALVAMVAFTVAANLVMKLGSKDPVSPLLLGLISSRTAYGLMVFGLAGLAYALVLRSLPLNVAQSFAAVQYVAVILASRILLGEPIELARWIGISLIAIGVMVVAVHAVP
jgi:multidrug transporter EmrE-like cation transporter